MVASWTPTHLTRRSSMAAIETDRFVIIWCSLSLITCYWTRSTWSSSLLPRRLICDFGSSSDLMIRRNVRVVRWNTMQSVVWSEVLYLQCSLCEASLYLDIYARYKIFGQVFLKILIYLARYLRLWILRTFLKWWCHIGVGPFWLLLTMIFCPLFVL